MFVKAIAYNFPMKKSRFLWPLIPALSILSFGCATPTAVDPNKPPMDREACRERIPSALEFATLPGQTRQFLEGMGEAAGPQLQPYLTRYYQVLGYNLSSVALRLDAKAARRTSLTLRENVDPAAKAKWLRDRLESGRSLFTLRDVAAVVPDGDFLRVDLHPSLPVGGSVFVFCGVIEGRTIGEQTFVEFYNDRGEARKMSLVALAGWMEAR